MWLFGKPNEVESLLEASLLPVGEVLSMVGFGCLLASSRLNVLTDKARRLLGKLVFALFLPCLIFTELAAALTLEEVLAWWFIPANTLLAAVVGCLVGVFVAIFSGCPPRYRRLVIVMTGIGNVGNIPLAIVNSICRSPSSPFGPKSACRSKGVAYIAFSQWVGALLVYTFVYHMMEPPEEFFVIVPPGRKGVTPSESRPQLAETEFPHLEEVSSSRPELRIPFLAALYRSLSGTEYSYTTSGGFLDYSAVAGSPRSGEGTQTGSDDDMDDSVACLQEPRVVRKIRVVAERTPLKHLMQPPVIASVFAIVVGTIPQFKWLLFGSQAPFQFVMDSFTILSGAMIPCIMLVLGGNLITGPGKSELGLRATVMICVTRLVLLPILGVFVVMGAEKCGFLPPNDPMFRFVLLLHHTMPSSILAGAMASLRGYGEKEVSSLLFWQHICSVFSMALFLFLYLNWLF